MSATRFRKRPVEVEAVRAADAIKTASTAWFKLPPWLAEAYKSGTVCFLSDAVLITTLEGTMRAEKGDWIIRGVQGELYPIKDAILRETYEPVREGETWHCQDPHCTATAPAEADGWVDDLGGPYCGMHG